ncbi:efflux RND transporter permease subunit [Stappia sp. ES.058]|uniref:efflux RND transporter permease subunit n=1 Tax=Stappia sp. ES.058 TaxID=1881061 RepID=UPI00087CDDE5|nr:efflux RND transporter permease subunit [Stappia sp. ES.058]SDU15049.1 multidrug efflux pump [Stappia sp. ES.058]
MIDMLESVLRRPRTVITLMLVMVTAGILAYIAVPKEADPDIDIPVFYVSVTQQGISPEDAERLLARPMETALRGLDGLKEITTISAESHLGVVLEFDISFDKDKALADVRDKVDQAKAKLPEEAEEPTINETNFALQPTIYVALSGAVPERTLYQHARRLKDEIEAVPTVLEAELSGHREEMLEVVIDSMKLESYRVTQQDLLTSLSQNNQLVPAGFLDNGQGRFNVKVPGLVENAEDVYSLPVKQSGEGVVTLGDIGEIRRTFKDPTSFTRVNGQPAITINVVKRKGTNIIENNAAVRDVVDSATGDWPDAIRVDYLLDKSENIFDILGSLQSSIMTAIFLVMILVIWALGPKSALLVGISIPTSFMIGFLILSTIGMTVNTMVMFGLVLTVGMLVDGAIVMVEYADRKIAEGMPAQEAYIRASRLMFWPIVSSTATTLAAFLPMLLWPGVAGEFMSYLPIMVVIVLSASLLTALVFLPVTGVVLSGVISWSGRHAAAILAGMVGLAVAFAVAMAGGVLPFALPQAALIPLGVVAGLGLGALSYRVFKPVVERSRARAQKLADREQAAARQLSADAHFDPKKVAGATGAYVRFLSFAAGTALGNVVTLAAVVLIAGGITLYFQQNMQGVEFFVDEEPEAAVILVSGRGNFSVREALDLVDDVEAVVLTVPGIDNVVMNATAGGGGGGGDGLGGVQDKPADVIGELNIELADFCCRRKAEDIFAEIRTRTASLPGIRVEVRKIEGGPPTGKDVNLQITSTSYDDLVTAIGRVRDQVDTMDGLQDREDSRPLPGIEWQITIDREQAGRFQAGIGSVGAMVQLVTNGVLIGNYRPDDSEDEVDIRVRLPESERTLDRFDSLRLQTELGLVPLSNFIDRQPQQKVTSITRRDGLYAMDVKANVAPDATITTDDGVTRPATADDKVGELQAWLDGQTFADNVFLKFRGADEDQKESGEFLQKAMIGSLFLMFIILVTQFNSFYQTILTLSTVIMSVFGVLLGMALMGQKFSIIMTGTGVVALAGIVVNNAIVLIDTYNRFREDGIEPIEAILKTSAQRIRPVLLTTTTTIAGLIPMMTMVNFDFFNRVIEVGSVTAVWWVQLSTAIIFGLGFSTILTLIMIPTMLAIPTVWMRLFTRRGANAQDAGPVAAEAVATGTPQPAPTPADAAFGTRVGTAPAPANVTPIGKTAAVKENPPTSGDRNDLPQAAE